MTQETKVQIERPASFEDLVGWRLALVLLSVALTLTLALYWASAASAVDLWWTRSTYNHGFLILPITLYLVWDKRAALAAMTPRPDLAGFLVTGGFSLAWVIARSAGINEGEHFALVGVMEGLVLAILGRQVFFSMLLPMGYLWLMVPTGTVFYPLLQALAHFLSMVMLQASGIPVFSQGFFIEVPTGLYEVAAGCSGLNFLLASLALAPLYGYMMYDSMRKRLIAIAVMLGVAVLANGFRIYGIIALAEFTDRRIDIVDDHILYGWGFFAVILAIMGYVGSRFADPERPERAEVRAVAVHVPRDRMIKGGVLAMVLVALLPGYRHFALSQGAGAGTGLIDLAGLHLDDRMDMSGQWMPDFPRVNAVLSTSVGRDGQSVDLYVGGFYDRNDANELISSQNSFFDHARYQVIDRKAVSLDTATGGMPWRILWLVPRRGSRETERLIAYSYRVNGQFTVSSSQAKLLQASATLLFGPQAAGVVALSLPAEGGFEAAEEKLTSFIAGSDFSGLLTPGGE